MNGLWASVWVLPLAWPWPDPIDGADAMADHPGLPEAVGTDDAGVIAKMTAWLTGQGWTVECGPLPVHTYGITSPLDHRVNVRDDVDDAMAAKTMLHEATHVLLHSEAESTAYLAAAILGLDTAAYSTGYVAGWAATSDDDLLITTASTVMNTARLLGDVVEG